MLNFRRKPLAAPASIDQEFVQIFIQADIVFPQSRKSIRNSRKGLQQSRYLNFRRKIGRPTWWSRATAGSAVAVVAFRTGRMIRSTKIARWLTEVGE